MDLTQEQFDALPAIASKTCIRELRAIHVHQNLRRNAASVETDTGHYRLSRMQGCIAAKAKGDFKGSTEGPIGKVLARIAFGEEDSLADSTHEEQQLLEEDPLEAMADELARESLNKLRELTIRSAERLLTKERGSIMAEALASITKKP
jgi:hypothetical protein